MKKTQITQIAGVMTGVFLLATASLQAAIISFDTPTTFTSATILDAPYAAGYSYVSAMNIGDNEKTFNTPGGTSITFAAGNTGATNLGNVDMPAASSSTTGFYNGGTEWNGGLGPNLSDDVGWNLTDIMKGHAYHNNASDATRPLTLRLAGLTIGETYAVYLFSVDQRSTDRFQAYWSDFSGGSFTGGSSATFSQNPATVVMGTFTADAAYQDVFIQAVNPVSNADTTLSAYTLYTVPEPGTFAMLLGGMGMLTLVRRRRA